MKTPGFLVLVGALASLVACAGHQTPRHDAPFGSPPENHYQTIQKYLESNFRFPPESRYDISEPRRGYMNKGVFLGGDVMWVGYLVDAHVQSVDRGFRRSERYVLRMRNNEVIEAHAAQDTPRLHDL